MTQQRHIDAAGKILDALYYTNKVSWADRITVVSHLSAALAEAENRAAWDVKLNQPGESTYEWTEKKYGPRPEVQP